MVLKECTIWHSNSKFSDNQMSKSIDKQKPNNLCVKERAGLPSETSLDEKMPNPLLESE